MENKVKKYEFIHNGMDDWTLKYKDKEIKFNCKVKYISDLQEIPKRARVKMVKDLAMQGMTVKDLIVEHTEGSKTIQDHSNKDFIEKGYIQEEGLIIMDNLFKEMFKMGYTELMLDIGITTEEEGKKFGDEIGMILRGQEPSGK